MSVYFYSCACCGEAVYEERVFSYSKCGRSICSDCAGSICSDCAGSICSDCAVGSLEQMYKDCVNDDGEMYPQYCSFCNGEIIAKDDLLNLALKKLNMIIRELESEYRKEHNL